MSGAEPWVVAVVNGDSGLTLHVSGVWARLVQGQCGHGGSVSIFLSWLLHGLR